MFVSGILIEESCNSAELEERGRVGRLGSTYFPEWLNTSRECITEDVGDAAGVDDDEGDRETH